METEQFTLEQLVSYQRNERGNQKIPRLKQKCKHNLTGPFGHNKDSA
jgi:hypothetical protein